MSYWQSLYKVGNTSTKIEEWDQKSRTNIFKKINITACNTNFSCQKIKESFQKVLSICDLDLLLKDILVH